MDKRVLTTIALICALSFAIVPVVAVEDAEVDGALYTIAWYDYDGDIIGYTSGSSVLDSDRVISILVDRFPESEGYLLQGWRVWGTGEIMHTSSLVMSYLDQLSEILNTTHFRFYAVSQTESEDEETGSLNTMTYALVGGVALVAVLGVAAYWVRRNR